MQASSESPYSPLQHPSQELMDDSTPSRLSRQRFFAGIRQHFWILLLLSGLGAALGWVCLKRTAPKFEATAALEVSSESPNVLNVQGLERAPISDITSMNTLVQAIRSRNVLERAAKILELANRPDFAGKADRGSDAALNNATMTLQFITDAHVRPNTRLLDVSVRHADPEMAAQLANTIALSLVNELGLHRAQIHDSANTFLVQEAERLRDKLKTSELALQSYKAENDAVSLDEKKDLVLTRLQNISTQLSEAAAERLRLQVDLGTCAQASGKTDDLLNIPSVSVHPKVSGLLNQISAKTADLAVLSERYLPKHPKHIALKSEIENLRSQLAAVLGNAVELLNSAYKSSCDLEKELQAHLKDQEKKVLELERMGVQYNVLKRDMETDEAIYQSVLSRLKEVDLTKGVQQPPVRLQQPATVPMQPVTPDAPQLLTLFTSGGGVAALGLIYLLVLWDSSFRTVADAERRLGLPVLAAITMEKTGPAPTSPLALECVRQPDGRIAENFRTLRAMVSLLGRQQQRRVVMFTSALPSEGKTFCASNYAISLAQQGLRTLLVDADLRRPRIAALHFPGETRPGVTDLILGTAQAADAIHVSKQPNLAILPAGRAVPNPAELLASIEIDQWLMSLLDSGFERIVIDSAPLLPVSDSFLIVRHVDTVLLVVKACSTSFNAVERVLVRLHESQKPPSGIVLNCLKDSAFSRENHDYYREYAAETE